MKSDWTHLFPPVSARQWKQQLQYELQGADYNNELIWESPEGIKVKPFYSSEDLDDIGKFQGRAPEDWRIAEAIRVRDSDQAGEDAHRALEAGAEAIQFEIPEESVHFAELMKGASLQEVPVHFRFGDLSEELFDGVLDDLKAGQKLFLHLDPIGTLARTGNWHTGQEKDFHILENLLKKSGQAPGTALLGVDGSLYQNAGANHVQQLAYCLSHAREYLHRFGPSLSHPPVFTMAAGGDYFFEIAKFRALRQLWAVLAPEYDMPLNCHIVGIPSMRNFTLYDYNNNILRATSACMAAILGGADTLINQPYDILFKAPNDFSRRIARNQLLILRHESQLDFAVNPADGSYYLESLTRQLAGKALDLFKQLEAGGGFLKQLREHRIQKKTKEAAAREQQNFDEGRLRLVGINIHRDPEARMKNALELPPLPPRKQGRTLIEPLQPKRLAAALEQKMLADE